MKNEMKRLMILGLIVALCMLVVPVMALDLPPAPCPTLGSCEAKEIQATVSNIVILSPGNTCEIDDTIHLRVTASFTSNADRYDVGGYVSTNSSPVSGGSACVGEFAPIPPFVNIDADSDLCGDIGAQTTVPMVFEVRVECGNVDANGNLSIPACLVWTQNKKSVCNDLAVAGTGSKCNCDAFTVHAPCAVTDCDDNNSCTDDSCSVVNDAAVCAHTPVAAGTACGSNSDTICDNPDLCDAAGVCQVNHEPAGTACGDIEGPCINPDACDAAGNCVDAGFKSAATACGSAESNGCNAPDHCNGNSAECVAAVDPVGTPCGDIEGPCINPDACDAAGTCVDGGFKLSTTECRASTGECDPAEFCTGISAECPIDVYETCNPWCGLTIGYWKNNVNKYVTGKTNGRQVCDEFFEITPPGFSCGSTPDCTGWSCINSAFQAKDQTQSQMMALLLTTQYHVIPEGDGQFVINCSEIPCSASLEACKDSTYPLMEEVLADLKANPSASIADCLNNYNDAQCSDNVVYDHCDAGSFDGLTNCANVAGKRITIKMK